MKPILRWLAYINAEWRTTRLSRVALGKYVVLGASLVHLIWAGLLIYSPAAEGPTPISILVEVFGGRYRTAFVLVLFAVMAMVYPFSNRMLSNRNLSLLLLPQQCLLWMSAIAVLWATWVGHYADGIERFWPFILGDQTYAIVAAITYTLAFLEAVSESPSQKVAEAVVSA